MIVRSAIRFAVALSVASFTTTTTAFSQFCSYRVPTSLSSYLDALNGAPIDTSGPPSSTASYGICRSVVGSVPEPFNSHTRESQSPVVEDDASEFPFASASFFGMDKLVSKGPRQSDWGTPGDASCKLCDDGTFGAGAWYCSEGGWPSPNGKAVTEIFYVLEGCGSLDDADGVRHYFGPGDNVIIPKGHTGRWDVNLPIRKVWAVNAHEYIEETSNTIRVQVDHYKDFGPESLTQNTEDGNDPLYGSVNESTTIPSSKTFYDVGPTKVGVWASEPGSYSISHGKRAWIHVLEGVVFVTNNRQDGTAYRCIAGDTIVLPDGWYGHIDVVKTTRQLWTVAE